LGAAVTATLEAVATIEATETLTVVTVALVAFPALGRTEFARDHVVKSEADAGRTGICVKRTKEVLTKSKTK
jgi:hypothetical protein